jgi:hypothetical protein
MLLEVIVGGGLRAAPEVLKSLDAWGERRHELAMQKLQIEYVRAFGTSRLDEVVGPVTEMQIEGMREQFIDRATSIATKRWPAIAAFAALVRPSVTWALLLLYLTVRSSTSYGPDDMALLAGVVSFWFVGRVWERQK